MSYFFTDHFKAALATNQNLMTGARIQLVLFRFAPAMSVPNVAWNAARTVAELTALPGWVEVANITGYPLTLQLDVGTRLLGASRYVMYSTYTFSGLGQVTETRAIGVVFVGTVNGVVNPLIFVTNTPVGEVTNIAPVDSLTSAPDTTFPDATNRWLFGWGVQNIAGTATDNNNLLTKTPVVNDVYSVTPTNHWWRYNGPNPNDNLSKWTDMGVAQVTPVEGPLVLARGSPDFEVSGSQHCWLYPQRANMIANPSFEAPGMNFWSGNGTLTRVSGGAPGGGAWAGQCAGAGGFCIMESNIFPTQLGEFDEEQWTIQLMAKGTGLLKVGLVWWDASYRVTAANWGEDEETFALSPSSWTHIAVHRHAPEAHIAMVRLELYGSSLIIDKVLAERGYLKDWLYFDGDEHYGARDDFSWYGGYNRRGQTYSFWYNHRKAVTGRLFARTVDPNDPSANVTDEDMEEQGLVYRWVPAGITVVPHLDILYPFDVQNTLPPKPAGVLPYNSASAPDGVGNPWIDELQGRGSGVGRATGRL